MVFLKFEYVNHRGEQHTYMGMPISTIYSAHYQSNDKHWLLEVLVYEQDGEINRKHRSFVMEQMRNIRETEPRQDADDDEEEEKPESDAPAPRARQGRGNQAGDSEPHYQARHQAR